MNYLDTHWHIRVWTLVPLAEPISLANHTSSPRPSASNKIQRKGKNEQLKHPKTQFSERESQTEIKMLFQFDASIWTLQPHD